MSVLVGIGVLATVIWTVVVNHVLWRQPMVPYLQRLPDLHEHLGDVHRLIHGGNPYVLRPRLNDTTPPLVALCFGALSPLSGSTRALAFLGINMLSVSAILTVALRTVLRRPAAVLFALSAAVLTPATVLVLSQAAYSGLWWGQDQILVMAMIVVDLLVVPSRYRGYLVGLGAGILLAPVLFGLLLLRPDWRSVLRAAVAFLGAALLAAMVNLHASTIYWFHLLPSGEAVRRVYFTTIGRQGNGSLFAFAARAPFAHHVSETLVAYVLAAIVAAIGLSAAWWAQSQCLSVTAVLGVGLTSAAIAPISWEHHWIWAILLPVVAIELWSAHRAVAVTALVAIPVAFLRAYPLTRAVPTTADPVVVNLMWSAPSLVTVILLSALGLSLWRSRQTTAAPVAAA